MAKTALLAGSTGLIGGQLLHLLLQDDGYEKVIAISRKPLAVTHAKLQNVVIELDQIQSHKDILKADTVFCCLGTIIKKAGSKEAFRKVDYDGPLDLAKASLANGAKQYLLVSALGADKNSSVFYNRVKGELEEAISSLHFETTHFFRPSLLLGPREEHRAGEDAAKRFFKVFGFLVPKKYKGIESIKVARAMLAIAKAEQKGLFIHESIDLQSY